jgi:hypothetical protein
MGATRARGCFALPTGPLRGYRAEAPFAILRHLGRRPRLDCLRPSACRPGASAVHSAIRTRKCRPSGPQALSPSVAAPVSLSNARFSRPVVCRSPSFRISGFVIHSSFGFRISSFPPILPLRSQRPPHVRKGPSGSLFVVGPLRGCVEGCAVCRLAFSPDSRLSLRPLRSLR